MRLQSKRLLFLILITVVCYALRMPPTAVAQDRVGQWVQEFDATGSSANVLVDLSGKLEVEGWDAERVRIEAVSGEGGRPDCAVGVMPDGNTVQITLRRGDAGSCNSDLDLKVMVPHLYDVAITAKHAERIVVRDIAGTVTGEMNPNRSISTGGSHTTAFVHVKGHTFELQNVRGEFIMRAAEDR